MPTEVIEHLYLLNKLADLANMKDDLWKYHPDNPKKINVNEIGKPTNMENNITPIKIKPSIAGSIKCEIIFYLAICLW